MSEPTNNLTSMIIDLEGSINSIDFDSPLVTYREADQFFNDTYGKLAKLHAWARSRPTLGTSLPTAILRMQPVLQYSYVICRERNETEVSTKPKRAGRGDHERTTALTAAGEDMLWNVFSAGVGSALPEGTPELVATVLSEALNAIREGTKPDRDKATHKFTEKLKTWKEKMSTSSRSIFSRDSNVTLPAIRADDKIEPFSRERFKTVQTRLRELVNTQQDTISLCSTPDSSRLLDTLGPSLLERYAADPDAYK